LALSGESVLISDGGLATELEARGHDLSDPLWSARLLADAPREIRDFFVERLAACTAAGIAPARIAIDPGIGFGKNDRHNIEVLRNLALFHELGVALLLGASRKSFIARLSHKEPPKQRLGGSLAAELAGLNMGVQMLRVHDVAETRQALAIWQALVGGVSSQP